VSRPVDIWVDPACPWAWITSRWLVEAAGVRDLDVRFHVMSLAILNADKATTPEYAEWLTTAHRPVRVLIAAEQRHGNAVLGPLYAAMGTRRHVNHEEDFDEVIPRSLAASAWRPTSPTRPSPRSSTICSVRATRRAWPPSATTWARR
jgi:hypothetical protein